MLILIKVYLVSLNTIVCMLFPILEEYLGLLKVKIIIRKYNYLFVIIQILVP
jgi:hypothetical protein